MNQFELRPCTVCGLLDGDYRLKKVSYCSVCDVWLCEKDVFDVVRRAVAAYKRHTGRLKKSWGKLKNLMFMGYGDEWSVVDDAGGGVLFVEQVLQVSNHPTVLQSATCFGTTSCVATFSSPVGAGSYILAYNVGNGNTTGIACTMTGETFVRSTGTSGASNNTGWEADAWLVTNAVGGQTATTGTASTGASMSLAVIEITSPLNGHAEDAGGNGHSVTTAMSVSTSASTTNAGDICIGMGGAASGGTGFTGLSWTPAVNVNLTNQNILLEYTLPGVTGVQTATATANTGANIAEGILCLKP